MRGGGRGRNGARDVPEIHPSQSEELEENHAHARHLSHTTHAVKKLPNTTCL